MMNVMEMDSGETILSVNQRDREKNQTNVVISHAFSQSGVCYLLLIMRLCTANIQR